MGTPVLTVPASPPPPTIPANHACHRPPRRLPPPLHGCCPQPAPRLRAGHPVARQEAKNMLEEQLYKYRAALLLRHSWLRPLRGHGTVLSYDGLPAALRLLST